MVSFENGGFYSALRKTNDKASLRAAFAPWFFFVKHKTTRYPCASVVAGCHLGTPPNPPF